MNHQTMCPHCQGQRLVFCHSCNGRGCNACTACQSSGSSYGSACMSCGGSGYGMACHVCSGNGRAPCQYCNASGFIGNSAQQQRASSGSGVIQPPAMPQSSTTIYWPEPEKDPSGKINKSLVIYDIVWITVIAAICYLFYLGYKSENEFVVELLYKIKINFF